MDISKCSIFKLHNAVCLFVWSDDKETKNERKSNLKTFISTDSIHCGKNGIDWYQWKILKTNLKTFVDKFYFLAIESFPLLGQNSQFVYFELKTINLWSICVPPTISFCVDLHSKLSLTSYHFRWKTVYFHQHNVFHHLRIQKQICFDECLGVAKALVLLSISIKKYKQHWPKPVDSVLVDSKPHQNSYGILFANSPLDHSHFTQS